MTDIALSNTAKWARVCNPKQIYWHVNRIIIALRDFIPDRWESLRGRGMGVPFGHLHNFWHSDPSVLLVWTCINSFIVSSSNFINVLLNVVASIKQKGFYWNSYPSKLEFFHSPWCVLHKWVPVTVHLSVTILYLMIIYLLSERRPILSYGTFSLHRVSGRPRTGCSLRLVWRRTLDPRPLFTPNRSVGRVIPDYFRANQWCRTCVSGNGNHSLLITSTESQLVI